MGATHLRQTCALHPCCRAEADERGEAARAFYADGALGGPHLDLCPVRHEPLPARSLSVAHHEAGHAVIAAALGALVRSATVDGQAHVHIEYGTMPLAGRAAISLAGPIAQQLAARHLHRPRDEEWQPFLGRVWEGSPGSCDECTAARAALVASGQRAGAEHAEARKGAALSWLRRVESETIEILRAGPMRAAIMELAGRLMEVGTVEGDEVAAIVARHVTAADSNLFWRRLSDDR